MAEKLANCILLWVHQGGRVSAKGLPVITPGVYASGHCDEPHDCYRCPLMQQEIARHPAGQANWVCPACITEVAKIAKSRGAPLHLTGHYTEGHCQYRGCVRPPRVEFRAADSRSEDDGEVPWNEGDKIEVPRGYSRFLQLVIGDINS